MKYIIPLLIAVTACTNTPMGKSAEKAQVADITSTALAIGLKAGTEANPVGLALIPIKLYIGPLIDQHPCTGAREATRILNTTAYGFTANNLAVLAGIGSPILAGVVLAGFYAYYFDEIEPPKYNCINF